MLGYKFILVLSEGLVFGLFATGVYVAFQWLRFPDLTPDGSFVLGGATYVVTANAGVPPLLSILLAVLAGGLAGSCTAAVNRFARVPAVVAGLLVALGLYSASWLLLGKPNAFLPAALTLIGAIPGPHGALHLLVWLLAFCGIILILLAVFANSIWGLRARAIGDNPLLALDLGVSETAYTFLLLIVANALVGLAGALFVQRSFSADVNMGIGQTLIGLIGMMLGLIITTRSRNHIVIISCIILGTVLYKGAVFLILEAGLPAESFRLISAITLVILFLAVKSTGEDIIKGIKWN